MKHWPLSENQRPIFAMDNQLYARMDGVGFSRFVDGKWVLEPGGELFKEKSLPGVKFGKENCDEKDEKEDVNTCHLYEEGDKNESYFSRNRR